MQFEFQKSMLPNDATIERLHSSYPNMFVFVKNEDGVAKVRGVESSTGSQRCHQEGRSYTEAYRFNPTPLVKSAKDAQSRGATDLITGYYNLLEDRFVQNRIFELPEIITEEFAFHVANTALAEQFDEMYYDNDLLVANLQWRDRSYVGLHLDYREVFESISHTALHEFVTNYYLKNKDSFKEVPNSDGMLDAMSMVDAVLEHFNIEKDIRTIFGMQNVLSVHDYAELVFYNKKTQLVDYMDGRLGNINLHDVMGSEEANNVYPISILHSRLIKMNK